jgi:hypothetical protein
LIGSWAVGTSTLAGAASDSIGLIGSYTGGDGGAGKDSYLSLDSGCFSFTGS